MFRGCLFPRQFSFCIYTILFMNKQILSTIKWKAIQNATYSEKKSMLKQIKTEENNPQ